MPRRILAFVVASLATAAALVIPALAATAAPVSVFAAFDTGSSLVTRAAVTTGEELATGGRAYTVTFTRTADGVTTFKVVPSLPASDAGKTVTFSVLG